MTTVNVFNSDNLSCILVDDPVWATANLSTANNAQATFSDNCISCTVGMEQIISKERQLIRVLDALGRETTLRSNTLLFMVYSDGSTQKVYHAD